MRNFCYNTFCSAGVAHPVERHLAKVEVASSSLVTRSIKNPLSIRTRDFFFLQFRDHGQNHRIALGGLIQVATQIILNGSFVG